MTRQAVIPPPARAPRVLPWDRDPIERTGAPVPRPVGVAYAAVALGIVAYFITTLVRAGHLDNVWLDGWFTCAIDGTGSVLALAGAITLNRYRRRTASAAFVLTASLFAWTCGDVVLTTESLLGSTASPSLADIFYLSFYPLAYAALVLFIRAKVRQVQMLEWLDGGVAGLGAAAVCAAFAFHTIEASTGQGLSGTITDLAYPVGDVILLGLVAGGFSLVSRKADHSWALLAAGFALNVAGDTSNLFQNSLGASAAGTILNAVAWPTAIVAISAVVWVKERPGDLLAEDRQPSFVLPVLGATASLLVLVTGSLRAVEPAAIGLATATLLVVGVRLVLSVRRVQSVSEERHRQSMTDELTGLGNRRKLFKVLDAYFAERAENAVDRSLSFLFVDLDRFKEINDSFGHPAGDDLLRQLGARLSRALRETDLLVRLGGDEFAVVLVDGQLEYATAVAKRLTSVLSEPFQLRAAVVSIGASIGIAMAPADATNGTSLVWSADVAMYRAKLARQPYACFNESIDGGRDQIRMLEELRLAIEESQLVLHYQPQLHLQSGEIRAVEALLRWQHPRLGLVPPVQFLPIAEEAGLMAAITRWVVTEAVAQGAAWRETGRSLAVSINVSSTDLLTDGFVEHVVTNCRRRGFPGGSLVIEVTETCVISDFERTRSAIEQLRAHGITVSIDDFGAGVTSLAYLSNLRVGELKLDRSFVAGLTSSERERELDIVRSTIDLGHTIGMRVVAEGIEDEETLRLLASLGCDFAQGYCIGRPKPADQLSFRSDLAAA